MVFGKKKVQEEVNAPVAQNSVPVEAHAQIVGQPGQPQIAQNSLQGAIEEFNSTYGGMFPPGDSSNNQALLFAIYAELRAIRLQG